MKPQQTNRPPGSRLTRTRPTRARLVGGVMSALLAVGFAAGGVVAPAAAATCIPDDNISYTYDPDTNSGVITVEDAEGSTGVTCDPLYVIAASWKMDNPPERWPQTRDIVNVYGAITTPGTYPFEAAVSCGQGDIYASHTPLEYPTPTLTAPSTPYVEHFLSGNALSDISGPSPTRVFRPDTCATPTPTPTPAPTPSETPPPVPAPSPTPQVGGVTVDLPPSTPQLGAERQLPSTGSDATGGLLLAGGLLIVGSAAIILRRRWAAANPVPEKGTSE